MKISILAVGKLKDQALRVSLDEYLNRIRRYCPVDELELRKERDLLERIPERCHTLALEVRGEPLSSSAFAARLESLLTEPGRVAFLIGGAEGLGAKIVARADGCLSLSAMTLPHRLARLVLCEQLYRAFTIIRGEPYARES